MRKSKQFHKVLVTQLPATLGYEVLTTVRDLLNGADAQSIDDVISGGRC